MVTAETVVLTPFVVTAVFLAAWVVSLGVTQARAHGAAHEAARLVARGETDAVAERRARQGAPEGSRIRLERSGDRVVVTVLTRSTVPLLDLGHDVSVSSVATVEP